MRKIVLALLFVFYILSPVSSSYVEQKSMGMDVSATNGAYHKLVVEPYDSDSIFSSDAVGMPFDLEGADVQYVNTTSTAGREIGRWSLRTNYTPVTVSIKASNLAWDKVSQTIPEDAPDKNIYEKTIGYVLFFPYEYHDSVNDKDVEGFIRVESGQDYSSLNDANCNIGDDKTNPISASGVGAINTGFYPIRFMLKSGQTLREFPVGYYTASVTVTVEGSEL